MKLFYFGSICSQEVFNKTVAQSKVKPSASAQNFESALIKGISAHPEVELTVVSAESIAPYPHGNRLFLRKRQDALTPHVNAQILPAINLPGIKQLNHAHAAAVLLQQWLAEHRNEDDKCVLVYGLHPKVVQELLKVCRLHSCRIYAVMTDVPSCMFTGKSLVKKLFAASYRRSAIDLQGQFDGYVYLTEAMKDEVAPGKPYIVVETMVDTELFNGIPHVQKASPPALMYAGTLYKKYGVDVILESFEQVGTPCELWLFGDGDYAGEIRRKAASNPRIRFFGRVTREEVLKREKEATLLLNIRNPEDEYTKYSFPSKMAEYMLSGTPLLTTKLPGMPEEYDSCCYTITNRDARSIATYIDNILSDRNNIRETGKLARAFVEKQKSCLQQADRILRFLQEEVRKNHENNPVIK